MTDPFPTVTRIPATVALATMEARLERANRVRSLLRCGVSSQQIADDMGISRDQVFQLERYAGLIDRLEPASEPEPEIREAPTEGRPWWSHPDAETIALCHVIRDEMKAAGA